MTKQSRDFLAEEMCMIECGFSSTGWDWWERYEIFRQAFKRALKESFSDD